MNITSLKRSDKRPTGDLLVFSHLRWNFVFQRPQHLMSRFALERPVYHFEEPIFDSTLAWLERQESPEGVHIAIPHLPANQAPEKTNAQLALLVSQLIADEVNSEYTAWYYTPMALAFTRHLRATATIYDCMDELKAFKFAPAEIERLERELMGRADLVFTGGHSLYESKAHLHDHIYPMPSSIDARHFGAARRPLTEPADQRKIPYPRIGFFGVIDERMDLELVAAIAQARPAWQIVMVGPVAKIDDQSLPRLENIHYLGKKNYSELPAYLAGWDVATMPFALNESTRFISPTKTLEYLAAGRPVVSTPIRDVVRPYGELKLVRIAGNSNEFINAIQAALRTDALSPRRLRAVDRFLSGTSWDMTWQQMKMLESALYAPDRAAQLSTPAFEVGPVA